MVLMVNGLFKSINKVNILKDISFSINENEILFYKDIDRTKLHRKKIDNKWLNI